MTENLINYVIIGITGILAVFSFVMGIEKMIKIILGNYILTGICLAASQSLAIFVVFLSKTPEAKLLWISYDSLAKFFEYGQTTLILILYAILLVIIYLKSKISIQLPIDEAAQKGLYVLLVPMTVISIILTLQIAIMGIKVIDLQHLQTLSNGMTSWSPLQQFFLLTPVRIFLHGIATIIITSELKISVKSI